MSRSRRRWKSLPLHLQSLEDRTVPATYTINSTNDTVVGDGNLTLREAITSMNLGNNSGLSAAEKLQVTGVYGTADTILFTGLSGTITLGGTQLPAIAKPVTITGPGAGLLSISGNNASRIFQIGVASATSLSGLTLTKGKIAGSGGAIYTSSNLTITDSVVTGSSASFFGGGISSYGLLTLVRTTVSANTTATQGGGFFSRALSMNESTVSGNSATQRGGGLELNDPAAGTFVIRNSTLSGNTAPFGAAISLGYSAGNPFNTSLSVQNSTITANSAASGGAVQLSFGTGIINFESTIVSGNNGSINDISSASTVNVNFSAISSGAGFTITGGNNRPFGEDLKLRTLANNGGPTQTHAFEFNSPLRNKGSNPATLTLDQRGIARDNSGIDIGALELNTLVTNTNDSGVGSLRDAVAESDRIVGTDTITFDSSFNSKQTITLTSAEIGIVDAVTIAGPGQALTTISGNNARRIFNTSVGAPAAAIVINNLTLTAGTAFDGGAIAGGDETITVNDCVITNSKANDDGAAIYTNIGTIIVNRSTLTGNTSGGTGGALYNENTGASIQINDSTISGNKAFIGGGIAFVGTVGAGGFTIRNSTISNNIAPFGGGVLLSIFSGTLTVQNSTIIGNSADSIGGGIARGSGSGMISLESSVVSGNTSPSGPDMYTTGTVNVTKSAIGSVSGWTFGAGSGNLTPGIDLKLAPLANNGGPTLTMLPAVDSPLRGAGSNPAALPLDQRGFPRTDGVGNVDIGAVQVRTTSVVSITRNDANPTSAASVSWGVTLANSLTGVSAANFTLSGAGAAGASISNVTGSGASYTVNAATGGDGALTLNFANSNNLSMVMTNLPFAGESYSVDKVALAVTGITVNDTGLTDADVGPSKFSLTATYSEAMNPAIVPAFSFPVENPAGSLSLASASWTTPTTFTAVYNVTDLSVDVPFIDVKVSGGKDTGGSAFGSFTKADLFGIDTRNPFAVGIFRDTASPTKTATVSWTVNFSEAINGLAKANFSLFNGGLSGSPAITNLGGLGSTYTVTASTGGGEGTLALYVDNGVGVIDANGNFLAGAPVLGGAYDVDHVSPAASKLTLNTLLVSDTIVGPNGFTAALKYNELMDQTVNPTVSFPAEFPNSLTFNSGVWLDARTYQAKFNIADLGVTQNNIDIRFSGAVDVVGNVQTPFDAVDVFDIDTQNPIISSIISNTTDGTYGVGAVIDVTLNFSEHVNLIGTLNVTLDTGAMVSLVGPQSGESLSGTYTVAAGQNSPDLNVTVIALTGGSTLRDDATNNSVLAMPTSNLANNAAIVVSTSAGVTSFTVNNGNIQRSRLTSITVTFASVVAPASFTALGAITLTRTAATPTGILGTIVQTGATGANGLINVSQPGPTNQLLLTFSNANSSNETAGIEYGSLTDGRWRLAIPGAGGYQSTLNDVQLRRLFGDFEAGPGSNGTVDAGDFATFGAGFGSSGAPGFSPFDYDNNGTVDSGDLGAFGARFGFSV